MAMQEQTVAQPLRNASSSGRLAATGASPDESNGALLETLPSRLLRQAFIALEIAAIVLSGAVTKYAYIDLLLGPEPLDKYLAPLMACGLLSYYVFKARGLHVFRSGRSFPRTASMVASSLGLTFLLLIASGYLFRVAAEYSRGWIMVWFATALLAVVTGRALLVLVLRKGAEAGLFRERVAVYGAGEPLEQALAELSAEAKSIELAGVFGPAGKFPASGPASGGIDELARYSSTHRLDQIIIALPAGSEQSLGAIYRKLSAVPCDIQLFIHGIGRDLPVHDAVRRGRLVLLELQRKPIKGWNAILKEIEDKTLGTIALVLFAPLMLAVAAAIKLDSKGPVFFRQRRHGFNHQVISVWKFRTMTVMEDGPTIVQAEKGDQRVTPVGRFLRKASLDELPQLFNAIAGDMSLVGPRPHALAHNEFYSGAVARYASRHMVKPGITGLAQINGFRGPTADPELMRRRVELDLEYIQSWSIWLDLKILALTPFFGITHKNAL